MNLEEDADEDQVINDIVQIVAKQGIRIKGIALLSPSLDEIYLNYVREGESA